MKTSAPQIVIIGAGLIGLSAADALMDRGCAVTILDARAGPVRGTSFANSGMIHPSQSRPWSNDPSTAPNIIEAVHDLAERSKAKIGARLSALSLTAALSRPHGGYQIFDDRAGCGRAAAQYARDGIITNRVPPEAAFGRPALFFPHDRSGDAQAYGAALAASLEARGAVLIYEADDVRLRCVLGKAQISLGPHIFPADHIIVAAGAQTPALLAPLGLDCPIRSVRGWSVDFDWSDAIQREDLPNVPVMDAPSRSAFTPFEDRFRLSGTWGEDSAEPLLRRWLSIMPEVMKAVKPPRAVWSGLRPVCDLGRPIIGTSGIDGLWVNAGHGHLGWTLCAGSGALLADMIMGGASDSRFAFPEI